MTEVPSKWERLGDLVLLPADSFRAAEWAALGNALWTAVGAALKADRVARQAPIANTGELPSWTFAHTSVYAPLNPMDCQLAALSTLLPLCMSSTYSKGGSARSLPVCSNVMSFRNSHCVRNVPHLMPSVLGKLPA